jgi:hypothetical protein
MLSRDCPDRARRFSLALCVFLACGALPAPAFAAAPQITNLPVRGFQTGVSTTFTIEGADLLPNPRILLPVPVASQVLKDKATANRVQIEVALPANVPPGMHLLRVANAKGVSNAVLVGIDDLPQVPFAAQIAQLPAALHGTLPGSATLQASFPGKKGQRMVVDLEARRLGSAIDPVVELYDSRRVQLAWSQGHAALAGDARLEVVLPADGLYTVEMHDILYRAGNPNHFRLKMGELRYADLVYPLGGQRGTEASFDLIGAPLTAQPSGLAARLKVDLRPAYGDVPAPLPRGFTGPAPRIIVSDLPEIVETDSPRGKLQEVTVPAGINGRIGKPNEEDRYRLFVKPGMKLRFDVLANRAGSPLDGVLTLFNEAGAQVAQNDDRPDTVDPGFDYTVPSGVTALVVALKDLQGRGGPNYVYRIAVAPADQPDFSLAVLEDRYLVPQGGTATMRVRAARAGYNGPIRLLLPELPKDMIVSSDEIPAGTTETLLSLTAPPSLSLAQIPLKIIGEGSGPNGTFRRLALLPETPMNQSQPWLRSELALAVTEPGPLSIAWDTAQPVLPIGYSYPAKVRVGRAPKTAGPVRLSLLTSQIVPKTPDGKQDDLKRALRLEGTPTIAADQEGSVASILVPGDLPAKTYDLAVRAELLSADGKAVLATAVTPSRRLQASQPLVLELAGAAAVKAKSGYGPTGKLTGKVVRAAGFNAPVTITLAGLPAGLPAPSVTVPAEQSDFELPVAFPPNTKLGPLPDVKLLAASRLSPQQALKSNEIPVAVQVVPGGPPPEKPMALFEDEQEFVVSLTEGSGRVTLEMTDRFSGKSSVRVTPDQRPGEKAAGLGIQIRQNPGIRIRENAGPGEYRFLRFAWKKKGGEAICLQLNHDGFWGPGVGKPGKFRYHAGTGSECYGASVSVDNKLPADWVVVTRDLFADFGEFTLTGIALSAVDGEFALFDHIYLGRRDYDFDLVSRKIMAGAK